MRNSSNQDPDLLHLAGRVADREPVDWAGALEESLDPEEHRLLSALKVIDALSSMAGGAPDEGGAGEEPPESWGHLEILGVLGRGSFGSVYVARDPLLERLVALKIYSWREGRPGDSREAVLGEGRLLARLKHPNVVTVYGVDERDGTVGLWMELVKGQTLAERVRDLGPLGSMEVATAGIELCRALAAVHRGGILHRDIKAQNVIREDLGRLVLVDFGLGLEGDRSEAASPSGTPLYLAPEVLEGGLPSVSSDLYSLGVLLFFLATGRHPVEGASLKELARHHREGRRNTLRDLRPELSEAFVGAVERAIHPRPAERFASAGEIEQALMGTMAAQAPRRGPKSSPWRGAAAGASLLAVVALVVLAILWLRRDSGDPPPQRPTGETRPRRLTTAVKWEAEPAISPDGTLVAYVSYSGADPDLLMMDTRGTVPLRLTEHPSADRWPSWFPDGSAVAFASDRGGRSAIWRVDRLGGQATFLVDEASHPAISPDGRRIAFSRPGSEGLRRIFVASLDAPAQARQVSHDETGFWDHDSPAWSPDGRFLCFRDLGNLWVVASDGGPSRALTEDGAGVEAPSWSASGFIYFGSYREGTKAIWRIRASGGEPQRVTDGTGEESFPRVSTDGSRMAFATFEDHIDIAVRNLSTGAEHRIESSGTENFPTFSPDGSHLAFVSDRHRSWRLFLVPLEAGAPTGAPRPLVPGGAAVSHLSFAPDGRSIAYQRKEGRQRDIYRALAAGGPEIPILSSELPDLLPSWSPDGGSLAWVQDRDGQKGIYVTEVRDGRLVGPHRHLASPPSSPIALAWSPDASRMVFIAAGEGNASDEVWSLSVAGDAAPQQLTEGVGARWLRWTAETTLLVSGRFGGEKLVLRWLDSETGKTLQNPLSVDFGSTVYGGDFDLSADGELLAYSYGELIGDIWVSEGAPGTF